MLYAICYIYIYICYMPLRPASGSGRSASRRPSASSSGRRSNKYIDIISIYLSLYIYIYIYICMYICMHRQYIDI